MNLANKTFKNNVTGNIVKIIDSFDTIAISEDLKKIDVRELMNPMIYTEQAENSKEYQMVNESLTNPTFNSSVPSNSMKDEIDPNTFFDIRNTYTNFVDQIKNLSTDGMIDEPMLEQVGGSLTPATNESAILISSAEDEAAELVRKYGASMDDPNAVDRQQQAFSSLLNEDELPVIQHVSHQRPIEIEPEVIKVEAHRDTVPDIYHRKEDVYSRQVMDDPITMMFKKAKRNSEFSVSIDIKNKIPRTDFIEMMEDSYEVSIIDFLAEEFTNKLLNDPSAIKKAIKDEIQMLVYGELQDEVVMDSPEDYINGEDDPNEFDIDIVDENSDYNYRYDDECGDDEEMDVFEIDQDSQEDGIDELSDKKESNAE